MEIEREFVFERRSCYVEEERVKPWLLPEGVFRRPEEISMGSVFGIWRCIFLFRFNQPLPRFPSLLCLSRNAKLEDIPNLANDLKFIAELKRKKVSKVSDQEKCSRIRHSKFDQPKPLNLISKVDRAREFEVDQPKPRKIVLKQDLNCLPDSETEAEESENDQTEHSESDAKTEIMKKKRAQSEHVAGLSLEDLSKYFGVPIVEASQRLNIGLTVLKKKCREFGIPRWPHRKIKSLDTLIHDLQVLSLHPSIILSIH
ncbi:unnamed protein product [Arabis nemorensis]|uniref:RWP-RK domain-containing protein n=1 Tax=Arabis nemorensis TaxID=586526 RepID=A0A565C947_9BRAS|nr:unnamed protein product [Arabis nemorensis]